MSTRDRDFKVTIVKPLLHKTHRNFDFRSPELFGLEGLDRPERLEPTKYLVRILFLLRPLYIVYAMLLIPYFMIC